MTPSKYRPRPQIYIDPRDNDSENEENDEPRRGTRKRAPANYVIPDIPLELKPPGKPRGRKSKSSVLSNVDIDGKNLWITDL